MEKKTKAMFIIRSNTHGDIRRISFEVEEYPLVVGIGHRVDMFAIDGVRYILSPRVVDVSHDVFANLGTYTTTCYTELHYLEFEALHKFLEARRGTEWGKWMNWRFWNATH